MILRRIGVSRTIAATAVGTSRKRRTRLAFFADVACTQGTYGSLAVVFGAIETDADTAARALSATQESPGCISPEGEGLHVPTLSWLVAPPAFDTQSLNSISVLNGALGKSRDSLSRLYVSSLVPV